MFISKIDIRPAVPRVVMAVAALFTVVFSSAASQAAAPPDSFADLAERLLPSVVNISTTQTIRNPQGGLEMPQFPPGSPLEEFFKEFLERQQGGGRPDAPSRKATSLGSGFIIDASGLIVTNNHVIADADEISVKLHDDSVFTATVVGRDPKVDLALLRIDPGKKTLMAVPFGNSDEARVGDWVLAIGNPFGFGGTVTAGIVSARARDINAGPYDDFLQTDAPINRGNSGGPMFNLKGEVIGINSAIISPSGGSIGIGFAIPSSLAMPVLDDLRKHGKVRRGWLGIRIQSLDADMAENIGLPDQHGALIAKVDPDGPGHKAGLKDGDVVLKFDGKDITEMRRLPRHVAGTAIGRTVDVVIWRNGKKQTIAATVGEMPEDPADQSAKGGKSDKPKPGVAKDGSMAIPGTGLTVATPTPQLRERFGIDDEAKGILVTEVKAESAAAEKGLRPGDMIIEADHKPVRAPQDLAKLIDEARKAGSKSLLLRVENPQTLRYVALSLAEAKGRK
ncbi:DegQ family serine endoprotease [Magnetospirillum sp. SS-4]|uniref:DegQ family serine endoprotease n=1 Tax=Magnetospirillum sp. SS-4 TaxID=2681465 RepID=UPI001385A84B|nr:DegQ family serine endoprotease [Magnetospirillum sp. SS-4]CAA7612820.1 putative periplasmic serine endoprotease DegP-like [Magnetospirillum sp. SS-4]